MNAVEIEEAVSELASQPFDPAEFPFQFLTAFGNKETTVRRLRKGESNASDVSGGVLQRGNIHIAVAQPGEVGTALSALRASPKTASQKAKFILATDGDTVEAEDLVSGDTLACSYTDLGQGFAFFLPLAGISTVKEIKNNPIDVKATGRLNRLYVELLKDNPDWATEARRRDLNQFMARLIFCFFAEDTGIFREDSFTTAISQMSHAGHGSGDERWGNTHEVLQHLFLAMDTDTTHEGEPDPRYRDAAGIKSWARIFPYVNGGLFTEATECPRFSRTARAYLLRVGELQWKHINPDIFGSMIQAVAEDDERGELGMHYTSVPNILKVLNPLFLDSLREQLEGAGDSRQKLRNLRKRLANIRVFDPACGSGNFLVIAYKEMRAIEAEIVRRLGGEANLKLDERRSVIQLSNFYGIEIKGFAAEVARLALLIAEFQADCLYLSQQEARAMVLPLHKTGQITVGNALRLDWLEVCPPVRVAGAEQDLGGATGRLALEETALSGPAAAETYICGNPPFTGAREQLKSQKDDLRLALLDFAGVNSLDYVCGWLWKSICYGLSGDSSWAFVATNSLCQGQSIPLFWGNALSYCQIIFAHRTFKWKNNATNNAAVHCVIVGGSRSYSRNKMIFDDGNQAQVENISPYLTNNKNVIIDKTMEPISSRPELVSGNQAIDGGHLIMSKSEMHRLVKDFPSSAPFFRPVYGAEDFVKGAPRYCIWVNESQLEEASAIPELKKRFDLVRKYRRDAGEVAVSLVDIPYRFRYVREAQTTMLVIPRTTTERREYLPVGVIHAPAVTTDALQVIYDADVLILSILSSKLHMSWIKAVAGRLKSDPRYSNTLVYNTFPIPNVTQQDKADLTRTAENILLAREALFPATIADLYDPEAMPDDLRRAHEENDEVLERIYIGRRFRNDTERLEKLFELYTRMTADAPKAKKGRKAA